MALQLEFTGFPDAESPLRWAEVPWDSANFGFPCYELELGSAPIDFLAAHLRPLLRKLAAEGRCFVTTRTPFGAVALSEKLAQHAFYHVETLVEVHASIDPDRIPVLPPVPDVQFEVFSHADRDAVAALASKIFVTDRFHLDPNLPNDGASRRYGHFVSAAFDSSEEVNGYRHLKSGDIIGFSTWRYSNSRHANWMLGGWRSPCAIPASGPSGRLP